MNVLSIVGTDLNKIDLPHIDYGSIIPMLFLVCAGLLLLLQSSMLNEKIPPNFAGIVSAVVGLAVVFTTIPLWKKFEDENARTTFAGAIMFDRFTIFFVLLVGIALTLGSLISISWLKARGSAGTEYYVLAMFASAGAILMASANDLIVIFLGLEILSIPLYILAGFNRGEERSREASMKYFVLGSFASAIFLYGIALTYGAIGSTNLTKISVFLAGNTLLDDGLLLAGMLLLGVGFAFKIAAVPFHQWTPDVYQGAPTPVVGFMAAIAKAGAFAALLRVFTSSLFVMSADWKPVILAIAVLTLLVGSVVACVQQNVKRMLAYSSISHAGFILVGVQAATAAGVSGSLFYLLTYTFMVLGTFAIVTVIGGKDDSNHSLEAYRGLGRRQPLLGLAFTVLLLAQAGVPPTAGFLAKFYVVSASVSNGSYGLAVFAMLAAAVAAFFYLRLIVLMYSPTPEEGAYVSGVATTDGSAVSTPSLVVMPTAAALVLGVAVVFTIVLGVLPQHPYDVIEFTRNAASSLF